MDERAVEEAYAFLRAGERARLRMQMEAGHATPDTWQFVLWLWYDRWMTREKWAALPPPDRDAYLSAFLRERAARRMVERAYVRKRGRLAALLARWLGR